MTRICYSGDVGTRAWAAFQCSCNRAVEALEQRVLLSTFGVINVNDSGPGSLRQAILDANAAAGGDEIVFDIPGPGAHIIAPQSPLPVVTDSLYVAGGSQPGYSSLTGNPVIELSGASAGLAAAGLILAPSAPNSTVEGLDINEFAGDGIVLQGSEDQLIGCFVGTDPSGTIGEGNAGNGVVISGANGAITGQTRADRNVISGNGLAGVLITSTTGRTGLGDCFIGTTADGMSALGNRHEGILANGPVWISGFAGGVNAWSRNVISGNGYSGIVLRGGTLASDSITGAMIGVNLAGTAAIPNGVAPAAPYRDGITLLDGAATIGQHITNSLVMPNVISGNRGAGIYLGGTGQSDVLGNVIGTDFTGSLPIGNGGDGIVIATDHLTLGHNFLYNNQLVTADGGNVIAANGGDGILIRSSGDTVDGQYVGVNIVGAPMGNRGNGVEIRGGSTNVIGEGDALRDIISANGGAGVSIGGGGTGNTVQGCFIGTTVAGSAPLGNEGNGVEVFASGNSIASNLIDGNDGSGILLGAASAGTSSGNMVLNNRIGLASIPQGQVVAASLTVSVPGALGNGGDGITIIASNGNTVTSNQISGNAFDGIDIVGGTNNKVAQNTLTQNDGNGVTVRESAAGAGDAVGNMISQNKFVANARLPIDLGDDGPTANDPGDTDTGPNQLQNFPVTVSAVTATVRFMLDTQPGSYRIEFYTVGAPDLSQGTLQFLGTTTVVVGTDPTKVYSATLSGLIAGTEITATASGAAGTSEFMPQAQVLPPPPQVTSAAYVYYNPPHPLVFTFDQDVSASLTPDAVRLHNVQTGQDFTPTAVTWDSRSDVARFVLPASLPIGDYVATLLASQVTNAFGEHLDGNRDGIAGDDFTYRFAYLPGDLNQDHTVDFNDLLILARQFGQTVNTASDLDGDGTVDFQDLLILAQNYGKSVPPPGRAALGE